MKIIKRILRILKTKPENFNDSPRYIPTSITGRPLSDNLSPIPRHDMKDFDKLVYAEDLNKDFTPKHPNPKFETSDKSFYEYIYRND